MAFIEILARLFLVYRGFKALKKIIADRIRQHRAKRPSGPTPMLEDSPTGPNAVTTASDTSHPS
jgi:hypothetical protein